MTRSLVSVAILLASTALASASALPIVDAARGESKAIAAEPVALGDASFKPLVAEADITAWAGAFVPGASLTPMVDPTAGGTLLKK